jgi:Flp pilus assembly protein TadG
MDVLRVTREVRALSSHEFRLPAMSRDERGAGTVMGLFWFMLLLGFCGLAIDSTDGFRNRTMLQATADASALAAVIDLPDQDAAKATAVQYATLNMGTEINGAVLKSEDVTIGAWDEDSRTFTAASAVASGTPLDAVHVMTKRTSENSNALPLNFLRILGLQSWDIRAQAIAERYLPDCLYDGLIANQEVTISSNNAFVNNICVHGQNGVKIQSNNYFESGVTVSMLNMDTLQLPTSGMISNPGLPPALREQGMKPRMVNHVDEIMQDLIDTTSGIIPDYINLKDTSNNPLPVIEVDEKFDLGTVQPHRIYHVQCKANKNARIPNNAVIQHVVIIAECELHIGSSAVIMNSTLGSRSGGNGSIDKADVVASSSVQLGVPDNCAAGGGVMLLSNATIHTASSTGIDGVQMVATGDIELGARDMGINGISAQSGGNINLTSNNEFGLCSGGTDPLLTVWYYRLVL